MDLDLIQLWFPMIHSNSGLKSSKSITNGRLHPASEKDQQGDLYWYNIILCTGHRAKPFLKLFWQKFLLINVCVSSCRVETSFCNAWVSKSATRQSCLFTFFRAKNVNVLSSQPAEPTALLDIDTSKAYPATGDRMVLRISEILINIKY